MITALVIWLFKRYLKPWLNRKNKLSPLAKFSRGVAAAAFLTMISLGAFAHKIAKVYHIKRNGEIIGKLFLNQQTEGENTYLQITSQVSTRFVFKVEVETSDVAHYKNGKLISSDISRVVNGKTKERKKTTFQNDVYKLQSGNELNNLAQPIAYNAMQLYVQEPVAVSQIYSDNFQRFIPLIKVAAHQYRLNLPDGNYSEYFFENGVCKQVIVHHSLYTIHIELA